MKQTGRTRNRNRKRGNMLAIGGGRSVWREEMRKMARNTEPSAMLGRAGPKQR